ncbi:unnamed protein product [Rotaria sp. Silwood2]|nr:unnamed protein product [Rotaria sp. Silwood2]
MTSLPNLLSKYVVFSYNKKNEELVLNIYNYLKNENLPVWIYVQDIINKDIYESERIPIIACRLLPNWKPSGWLNKVTSDQLTIDLHGINQRNFKDKMNKLREKIISVLENKSNSQISFYYFVDQSSIDKSIIFKDSNMFCVVENINTNCFKEKLYKYKMLPKHCRLSLSNLMICNNEYLLKSANNHLHLFDQNLKPI